MLESATVRDFLERPEGRYVAGQCWITFCDDAITGAVVRGSVTIDHTVEFLETMPMSGSPLATRRPRYLDLRELDQIDEPSVAMVANWLATNSAMLRERVTRAAVISRGRLGRSITNGLLEVPAPFFDISQFDTPASGLAWLGARDSDKLAAELGSLTARLAGTMPVVQGVRDHLAKHLGDDLAAVARALGYSTRGLQRRLRDEQSSFQRELDFMRVEAARALLARADIAIADVAHEVGTSQRNLITIFRRLTGAAPRDWRTRRRARLKRERT